MTTKALTITRVLDTPEGYMDKAVFRCGCTDMILVDNRTDPFTGTRMTNCGNLVQRTVECSTAHCIG